MLVEAVDCDLPALIFHCSEQVNQRPEGVWHNTSPMTRMEILVGAPRAQFDIKHTAYTKADDRLPILVHWPIADDHQVGLQFIAMRLHERGHMRAAHLFFALEQHF